MVAASVAPVEVLVKVRRVIFLLISVLRELLIPAKLTDRCRTFSPAKPGFGRKPFWPLRIEASTNQAVLRVLDGRGSARANQPRGGSVRAVEISWSGQTPSGLPQQSPHVLRVGKPPWDVLHPPAVAAPAQRRLTKCPRRKPASGFAPNRNNLPIRRPDRQSGLPAAVLFIRCSTEGILLI